MNDENQKLLNYTERIKLTLAQSFKFDIWGADDIGQEIFILVKAASHVCDPDKIEDEYVFYFNYVRNRLLSLKRDKSHDVKSSKKNIQGASPIHAMGDVHYKKEDMDIAAYLESDEIKTVIDKKIAPNVRADYLRILEGIKLPYHVVAKVKESIVKIAESFKWDIEQGR